MNRILLLSIIILLITHNALAQDGRKLIGEIEFFGYAGIDLEKVRAALPFHEKEIFPEDSFGEKLVQAGKAIESVTGHPPTDISGTCCDREGNWIIFIGLSGKHFDYNPKPSGTARLPENILKLYDRFLDTNLEGVKKGAFPEDDSKGYALGSYPPLRSTQLEMRAYALNREKLLRTVLETSAEDRQRIAASELLGYSKQSDSQILSLIKATRDSNNTVRNNATRALLVLAASSRKIASRIPVEGFIELLLSGTWTDLNKSSGLLDTITKSRDAKVLASLRRKDVLERLIEMARWRSHWNSAAAILGRVAGIDEQRLSQLIAEGKVEVIIKELQDKRGQSF